MKKTSVVFCVLLLHLAAARFGKKCGFCDENVYQPICADGQAFRSLCVLQREICLGNVALSKMEYGNCVVPPILHDDYNMYK